MDRRSMNTTYMQEQINLLHKIHNKPISDYGELIKSLNQEVDILCDLIPQYKIGDKLDQEVRKKKEVFTIEKLEHELLIQYTHFLQLLKKFRRKQHPEQQAVGSRLAAKLLPIAKDFNKNEELISIVVDFANARVTRVAQPCLQAIATMLDGELVSEATQKTIDSILAIVRKQQHAINPKLIGSLLHLRVAMIDIHRPDIAEEKAKNKRLKKQDRELARQMQKANARRDRAEIATKQTRIVHHLFIIYLRLLQASQSCSQHHQSLILGPTLEGLAKFSQLVNAEMFDLLIKALRELLEREETSIHTRLHALVAVACLAKKDFNKEGADWRTDLVYYHNMLFKALPQCLSPPQPAAKITDEEQARIEEEEAAAQGGDANDDTKSIASTASVGSLSSQAFSIAQSMAHHALIRNSASKEWVYRANLVIRAVDLLVLSQRHIPVARIQAFVRRLSHYIPLVPPHISMAIASLCHHLMVKFTGASCIVLGGADNYVVGTGRYDPEAPTIDAMHAESSFTWEASLLRNSYHPAARQFGETYLRHYHKIGQLMSQHGGSGAHHVTRELQRTGPYEILERYDPSLGDVVPCPPATRSRTKRPREEAQAAES